MAKHNGTPRPIGEVIEAPGLAPIPRSVAQNATETTRQAERRKNTSAKLDLFDTMSSDPRLTHADVRVGWRVLSHLNAISLLSWPSTPSLAAEACCDLKTARRSLRSLEAAGYFRRVRGGRGKGHPIVWTVGNPLKGAGTVGLDDQANEESPKPTADALKRGNNSLPKGGADGSLTLEENPYKNPCASSSRDPDGRAAAARTSPADRTRAHEAEQRHFNLLRIKASNIEPPTTPLRALDLTVEEEAQQIAEMQRQAAALLAGNGAA